MVEITDLDFSKFDIMGFLRSSKAFIWNMIKTPILWLFHLPTPVKIGIWAFVVIISIAFVIKAYKEREEWRRCHI